MKKYFKYIIENIEPLRIADDSTSQNGQTVSLKYIPGSSIRGIIINAAAKLDEFEEFKGILLSDKVSFLNAYPTSNDVDLIPSPKGFYEDKSPADKDGVKELENVVINGDFTEGNKRASLGRFATIEQEYIYYGNIETDSDLKIKINPETQSDINNSVFRNEYVPAGYRFVGYIAVDDSIEENKKASINKIISDSIRDIIIIGNAKTAGLGKCRVISSEITTQIPYSQYLVDTDVVGSCYMLLLSHTVMRNENGEFCGLNLEKLANTLGVDNLEIEYCSTSTVDIRGYNRKLGIKLPSVNMYEAGSVFKLKFDGTLSAKNIQEIVDNGIGVRRNEGFGRVIFIKDYENIKYKKEIKIVKKDFSENVTAEATDKEMLKLTAINFFRKSIEKATIEKIVKNKKRFKTISNSKVGKIEGIIEANRYDYSTMCKVLDSYFGHENQKEQESKVHKNVGSVDEIERFINDVRNSNLADLFGVEVTKFGYRLEDVLSYDEIGRYKISYINDTIKYARKDV